MAKKMKDIFGYVEISLDGFEEAHDRFRGSPKRGGARARGLRAASPKGSIHA